MNKNVTFSKETAGTNITSSNDNEEIGVMHLKRWNKIQGLEKESVPSQGMDEEDCVNETFSVEVPKKFHDHPKILEAKKKK